MRTNIISVLHHPYVKKLVGDVDVYNFTLATTHLPLYVIVIIIVKLNKQPYSSIVVGYH